MAEEECLMEVGLCAPRPILQPCSLEGHTYQADPYIGCEHDCRYCYAQNDAEVDWPQQILIHPDLEQRLVFELEAIAPQSIYMGMNSDPYQPAEERRLQTRKVLEVLAERGFSVCILTKSALITRDVDVFEKMPDPYLGFSIAFQNEHARSLFERNAPTNKMRLQALEALRDAGIRTYVLICPVMPYITDVEALIEEIAPLVDHIYVYRLRMNAETDTNWQRVKRILSKDYPELVEPYRRIAFSPDCPYWAGLRSRLHEIHTSHEGRLTIEV
jgi:DNA repair photolyase